jgi:hypothetical protein
MAKILLVEPDYQNKYPPIGLMKIATFHRNRGDIVEFYKGEAPYTKISQIDRVYITSLFTFYYDITLKCIRHYQKYVHNENIFIGGIAATLLTKDFEKDTGIHNIICGQLTNSGLLGYKEKINIDCLPLDYDILDDIPYIYPMGNNYFIYTSRGCKRGCDFCAVPTLEPEFITTNNIIQQVKQVDEIFGQKRNMLIMDNNTLFSEQLESIVDDILSIGFTGKKDYIAPNSFNIMMKKIKRRKQLKVNYSKQIEDVVNYLNSFSNTLKNKGNIYKKYTKILKYINTYDVKWGLLKENEKELTEIIEKYRPKPKVIRYIDFNQGLDARLINKENCALLAKLPIKPFRLAYDSSKETKVFIRATKIAIKNKISDFSNYMLYNYRERPTELWSRLFNAISLYNNDTNKLSAFSFPMKYAPIDEKKRNHIGKFWNKKYLSAINIILNVTKGVVAKEFDFFFEAYGKDKREFLKILTMPDEFIRFRHYFRDIGLIDLWEKLFNILTKYEKKKLLKILCDIKLDRTKLSKNYSENLNKILQLYAINKSQFDRGEITARAVVSNTKKNISGKNIFLNKIPSRKYSTENLVFLDIKKTKTTIANHGFAPPSLR